jgi:hypothetical protein
MVDNIGACSVFKTRCSNDGWVIEKLLVVEQGGKKDST